MAAFESITGKQREADKQAFRYAQEMLGNSEYRGRSWESVEPDLRRDWEQRYVDRPWHEFSESIRNAWESSTSEGSDEADRLRFDEERGTN